MAGKIGRVFLLDSHMDMFECTPRYEAKYIHRAKAIPAKCTFYKVTCTLHAFSEWHIAAVTALQYGTRC